LKYLDISYCSVAVDALSALPRCRGLNELRVHYLVSLSVLLAIGKNLVDGIVDCCPNLQCLILTSVGLEGEVMVGDARLEGEDLAKLKQSLKQGLKKLMKLNLNEEYVRLN
jgi:hypothetical protein